MHYKMHDIMLTLWHAAGLVCWSEHTQTQPSYGPFSGTTQWRGLRNKSSQKIEEKELEDKQQVKEIW